MTHPFVIGELALGSLRNRATVLDALAGLPMTEVARDDEVLRFITRHSLSGQDIGYIDSHLLAGVRLTQDAMLWTWDRRLHAVSAGMKLAFTPEG